MAEKRAVDGKRCVADCDGREGVNSIGAVAVRSVALIFDPIR